MNSLCQFCIDSNQNCDVVQVAPSRDRGLAVLQLLLAERLGTAYRVQRKRREEQHEKCDGQGVFIEFAVPSHPCAPATASTDFGVTSRGSLSCGAGSFNGFDSDEPFW